MKSLENQIAVVAGASRGIGKSIALELAKQGAVLCLLGRDLSTLEEVAHAAEQSTRRVHCYCVDITIDQEIADFIGESRDEVRGILQRAGRQLRDLLSDLDSSTEGNSEWHPARK